MLQTYSLSTIKHFIPLQVVDASIYLQINDM